jgi:ankyrin repeat protein
MEDNLNKTSENSVFNIAPYILNIKESWKSLKKLPKLSQEQIKLIPDDLVQMYLYAFYFYPEIYTYSLEKLKRFINSSNDSLCLLGSHNGFIELLEYLEGKGFDINYKNNYGFNAYLVASSEGQIKVMEYLESKGFNIHYKNYYEENAYSLASYNGKIKVIKYLDSKGFDINSTNTNGTNAYLLAVDSVNILKYYDTKNYKFKKMDYKGDSVLKLSINSSNFNTTSYLLESKYKQLIQL